MAIVLFFCPQTPNIGGFWRFLAKTIEGFNITVVELTSVKFEGFMMLNCGDQFRVADPRGVICW